jgi:hypothetical protein
VLDPTGMGPASSDAAPADRTRQNVQTEAFTENALTILSW